MATSSKFEDEISELAAGGGPVLEALARMNSGMFDSPDLDQRTILLMRFAALVALDAPAQSYLVTLALADQAAIAPEVIQAGLVALAPVVGGPRVISAATNVMQAVRTANS
jgi:4-carboxymuconolactone decarboxylase